MAISDKQKQLLRLLADGEFHSGTELAKQLAVSRAAIWKQIVGLDDLGLVVQAVRGRGYRLANPLEFLDPAKIIANLDPTRLPWLQRLEVYDQLDSTNTYLSQQAQIAAPSGFVCFAEHQTAGKGRRGRQWVSPFGSNLYLSMLWRFQNGYASTAGLSLVIGVATIRALHSLHIDPVGLKWPNDILSNGKKLGGILIEVTGESEGPCAVVIGLGLNLHVPDAAAEPINQAWTDIGKIQAHRKISRNLLAARVLNHLFAVLADFESVGLLPYLAEWRQYDALQGQTARLFVGEHAYLGIVQGINDQGLLLLQHADGKVQAFASGEVSFSHC